MDEGENLRTMAEIAVALAGFTGIVVVMGHRALGTWAELELLRLKMLLITSLAVLFFSLLPLVLMTLNWTSNRIWTICNSAIALTHLVGLASTGLFVKQMDYSKWSKKEKREELLFTLFIAPLSIAIIGFQIWFSIGHLNEYGFFLFFTGLIYWTMISALHFVLLLLPEQ